MNETTNLTPVITPTNAKKQFLVGAIGIVGLLLITLLMGIIGTYVMMKSQIPEKIVIEKNNTIILERNITITTYINMTDQQKGNILYIHEIGSLDIITTRTTLPAYRLCGDQLCPEDADRMMNEVKAWYMNQSTTTTTSTTFKRLSTAPMYGLYNPMDAIDYEGTFLINRSVDVTLRTVDGSDRVSRGTSYRLEPVTPAEARYYANNIGDQGVEQVLYQLPNGTITIVGSLNWMPVSGQ